MSGKFGGGGTKCFVCDKTAYPAETITFEKVPYHAECFKCKTCSKKMEGAAKAAKFGTDIYCHQCFKKGGFAQKQKTVKWVKKESTGSALSSKFGGGGNPCTICAKTVYPAETINYEKKPYHQACFKCSECTKKLTPSDAAQFEGTIFCRKCFASGGYTQKQAATAKKAGSTGTSSAIASKFGGGGNPCTICQKTVYTAEAVSYEKKVYHSKCFKCKTCSKKIAPSGAAQFEGTIFCTKCFGEGGYRQKQAATAKKSGSGASTSSGKFSRFGGGGNKCNVCDKTVYPAETVSYEKKFFHTDCFKCSNCSKKVTPSSCEGNKTEDNVDIYCKKCWGELGLNRAQLKTN